GVSRVPRTPAADGRGRDVCRLHARRHADVRGGRGVPGPLRALPLRHLPAGPLQLPGAAGALPVAARPGPRLPAGGRVRAGGAGGGRDPRPAPGRAPFPGHPHDAVDRVGGRALGDERAEQGVRGVRGARLVEGVPVFVRVYSGVRHAGGAGDGADGVRAAGVALGAAADGCLRDGARRRLAAAGAAGDRGGRGGRLPGVPGDAQRAPARGPRHPRLRSGGCALGPGFARLPLVRGEPGPLQRHLRQRRRHHRPPHLLLPFFPDPPPGRRAQRRHPARPPPPRRRRAQGASRRRRRLTQRHRGTEM
ncbi:MAG: Ribonuclease BN, partial [uncultured Gemmatimonadetes bacterium]